MIDRIVQVGVEFFEKIKGTYVPAYFSWLTEKLSAFNPFALISISITLFFILVLYIWTRNRTAD